MALGLLLVTAGVLGARRLHADTREGGGVRAG
jgi:hypothetical protein